MGTATQKASRTRAARRSRDEALLMPATIRNTNGTSHST